ncbi:RICIN domain-containing protein [Pilimelia terevasa]|nr:RICIN domain-containing protein [Pilimelia terevasa]
MASQEPTSPTPPERLPEAAPRGLAGPSDPPPAASGPSGSPPSAPGSPDPQPSTPPEASSPQPSTSEAPDPEPSATGGTDPWPSTLGWSGLPLPKAGAGGDIGRAAVPAPPAAGDPTSTSELPAVPADPATATTLYESRVAPPPRRRRAAAGSRGRAGRGNTVVWLLGGLCLLGMVVGVTLAAGIVDIQPIAAGDDTPPPPRPAATTPVTAVPTRAGTDRSAARPTPSATTRTPSPTASPSRDTAVPPRRDADRTGALRSVATQLCARAGQSQLGQPLVLQNRCDDGGEQWRLTQSDGEFSIVHERSARCLATRAGAASVTLVRCGQDDAQRWRLGIDGTIFAMANVATDQCLDVPAGAAIDGLVLVQVACNSTAAQSWQLVGA